MDPDPRSPWRPDPRVAEPALLVLSLVVLALVGWRIHSRGEAAAPPDEPTLVGRVLEVQAALPSLDPKGGEALKPLLGTQFGQLADRMEAPWDRAVLAVLAADSGQVELGESILAAAGAPAGDAGEALRNCFAAAFGEGTPPGAEARALVRKGLGDSLAAATIESRLVTREGGDGKALVDAALRDMRPRLFVLAAGGLALLPLALIGIGFSAWLLLTPRPAEPPPARLAMSGTALACVLVGWVLALLAGGELMPRLARNVPAIAPVAIPLGYLFHAAVGLGLVCAAEGVGPLELLRRLTPGSRPRALVMGLGFYTTTLVALFVVGALLQASTRRFGPPQQELMEQLSSVTGPLATGLLFATVAGVAPLFEEILFRGVLMGWLLERTGAAWAVVASALVFALLHMTPAAIAPLATLGLLLGLNVLRTRSIASSVVVHAIWNGTAFVLMRTLA